MTETVKEVVGAVAEQVAEPITTALVGVSQALKDGVNQYGPDAVELALYAVQVGAIESVVSWLFCVAAFATLSYAAYRGAKKERKDEELTSVLCFCSFLFAFLSVSSAFFGFNLPNLFAAFGNPKLLLATKALEAAGVM